MIITHKGRTVEIHQEKEIPAAIEQLKRQEPGCEIAEERQPAKRPTRRKVPVKVRQAA